MQHISLNETTPTIGIHITTNDTKKIILKLLATMMIKLL